MVDEFAIKDQDLQQFESLFRSMGFHKRIMGVSAAGIHWRWVRHYSPDWCVRWDERHHARLISIKHKLKARRFI